MFANASAALANAASRAALIGSGRTLRWAPMARETYSDGNHTQLGRRRTPAVLRMTFAVAGLRVLAIGTEARQCPTKSLVIPGIVGRHVKYTPSMTGLGPRRW